MPASRCDRPAQAHLQLRGSRRCRKPHHPIQGQAVELGRRKLSFARARANSRSTNKASVATAASPRPDLPPSTCQAAARRCALRCRDDRKALLHLISTPGCSISTTRSTRTTSICGSRWTSGSANSSAAYLKISEEEARVIQKDYYRRYGTSMRGMMTEHGVHADDYLAYVHQIDHSPLEPNPAMGAAIARLPGRKLILTNGSTDHAEAVLTRLGIGEHFEAVFDIIAADLEPKPAPQTYRKFLKRHDVDREQSGDVRGSGAQPGGPPPARHDHGSGRARRHKGSRARRLGARRPRRSLMSIMSPTI